MRLKYYLRGLGIGILVTAIIMHLAVNDNRMSDEEIRNKAKELGMVEEGNLSLAEADKAVSKNSADSKTVGSGTSNNSASVNDLAVDNTKDDSKNNNVSENSADMTSENGKDKNDNKMEDDNDKNKVNAGDEHTEDNKNGDEGANVTKKGESIIINVSNGDSSYAVAKKMQSAGLVESAAEFDEFLCVNGYDKVLSTGDHKLYKGDSFENLAKGLSGKQ